MLIFNVLKPYLTYCLLFHGGEITMGGYSNNIVVDEHFAVKIPEGADLKRIAPLLCAGLITSSPIMFSHVKKGEKVGVAGFGGLGHMAVQYAVSLGTDVTVFDVTEEKREDALRMGAARYVNVNNPEELKGLNNTMDFIISTIPARYEPLMYVSMLKKDGELAIDEAYRKVAAGEVKFRYVIDMSTLK